MSKVIYFDSEGNGLLHDTPEFPKADKVWCVSFLSDKGVANDFILNGSKGESLNDIGEYIADHSGYEFICHNLWGFDLEFFRLLLGIQYGMDWWFRPEIKVLFTDTLDRSQSQYPDRPHPRGCPYVMKCPLTGKNRRIGSHGLDAWGYRIGNHKPTIHDWRNDTIENYLHRCKEDVIITKQTHIYLDDEMNRNKLR